MRRTLALAALVAVAPLLAGFDLSSSRVPEDEIVSGGPPKDGIPAIVRPKLVPASEAGFLEPDDRVVGLVVGGEARAYPLRILNWHEVVNDAVDGKPIAVTYCPLTASAIVFDREIGGATKTFGVSGRLYQSNVLLYDHQTESLWSQLGSAAITGPGADAKLRAIASVETSWDAWREAHPDTLVLSPDTGFARAYARDPYAAYHRASYAMFETRNADARLAVKDKVFGLEIAGESVAYPLARLAEARVVEDRLAGVPIRVEWDPASSAASATRRDTGEAIPGAIVYWFAWTAFHPETRLWGGAASTSRRDPPAGDAEGNDAVAVQSHSAYWAEIPMVSDDRAESESPALLVIRGELVNRSQQTVHHVKLRHELLDREGSVVAVQDGFNRGAESLLSADGPDAVSGSRPDVLPLQPKAVDAFRMLFLAGELPAFDRYRVRVVEVATHDSDD